MATITRKKLKKIVYGLDGMTKEEWDAIKPYIEHKLEVKGFLDNPFLVYKTLKQFFIKATKEQE